MEKKHIKNFLNIILIVILIFSSTNVCYAEANYLNLPNVIETDELKLSKTTASDALILADFLIEPNTTKYLDNRIPWQFKCKEDALRIIMYRDASGNLFNQNISKMEYTIYEKSSNNIVGQVVLEENTSNEKMDFLNCANIYYFIGSNYRGHNYAYKASKALLGKVFQLNNAKQLSQIITFVYSNNVPSIKVLEKLGGLKIAEENLRIIFKKLPDDYVELNLYINEVFGGKTTLESKYLSENILYDVPMERTGFTYVIPNPNKAC